MTDDGAPQIKALECSFSLILAATSRCNQNDGSDLQATMALIDPVPSAYWFCKDSSGSPTLASMCVWREVSFQISGQILGMLFYINFMSKHASFVGKRAQDDLHT